MRTVSDAELFGVEGSKVAFQKEENQNFPLMAMPGENSQLTLSDNVVNSTEKMPLEVSNPSETEKSMPWLMASYVHNVIALIVPRKSMVPNILQLYQWDVGLSLYY